MALAHFARAALAAAASLSLLILGQPALAQGYPPRITEVIVDGYDALILIVGEGFDQDAAPVVRLDDDPLPLGVLSVTEYEIEARVQRAQCLQACPSNRGESSDLLQLRNSRSNGQSQATEAMKKINETNSAIISNIR